MLIKKNCYCLLLLFFIMTEAGYSQDWANLGQFKEDNKTIGLPAPGEKRVVFMGNSITSGWLSIMPTFFTGKPYINRGISGQTSPQMLLRFRQDVIALQPKCVVILAGTNDIAGNTGPSTLEMIEANIASMAELALTHKIRVVLCAVLPVFDYPWKPGQEPADKIITLNKWIAKFAKENKCIYLDYHSAMADERNGLKAAYGNDGVHPNEAGYKVMAVLAEKAIHQALGKYKK